MIGWNNVSEMTKFGMPGVFTHGNFDTWSPGYLMFIAALHNGISRLYETFGNGGADTVERTLQPNEYARTWYKQNPPLPKTVWSQRNNNNYEETGLLTSLHYFAANSRLFLRNFYLKSKRSILKAKTEGPAAYVFPADDPRPGAQADLLRILQKQGVEISRATASFTVTLPSKRTNARPTNTTTDGSGGSSASGGPNGQDGQERQEGQEGKDKKPATTTRTFAAGSYIVRMDQPYSRIADSLLDYQYWSPNDPQRTPYDDTGWTFPELFNVHAVRVVDATVLDAAVEKVTGDVRPKGAVTGTDSVFLINHNADTALATLRYMFKDGTFEAAEEAFETAGQKFTRGSFIITNVAAADMQKAAADLGLQVVAASSAPSVKTHPLRTPRVAIMHTWATTQTEGWWRQAFDNAKVPFTYISTQRVAKDDNLNAAFDVIVFPPARGTQVIVNGLPMNGNPLPWKKTAETPNLGSEDQTDDMRPGMGWVGVAHLQDFVRKGGLLLTSMDTADFAVTTGFTPGLSVAQRQRMRIIGSVVRSKTVDATSPIAYGYTDNLAIWCENGPIFNVSNLFSGGGGRRLGPDDGGNRPTGRGTTDDPDQPQGRLGADVPEEPRVNAWQASPVTDEQMRNGINVIPPAARPRVILRYADNRELLVSGLVENGTEIAQHPAVVDVPLDKGHVVVFSNNPMWRGETEGSYFMVFNALLNYDQLNAGRKLDAR
jgi:hypothetical protein